MFSKAYKLKSNNTLKNSEKKHLIQRIHDEFSSVTEEKVKELLSVKCNSSCMKVILHSGETVGVYVVEGVPVMIDVGEELVPTVHALWKLPDLVPTLTIHSSVLGKIQGGAPLYLPGVTIPAAGVGFPMFKRGKVIAASTQDNAAAALVGRAALSSGDMLLRAGGVCLETLHVFGDLLCKEPKFTKMERPKLGPAPQSLGDVPENLAADVAQLSIQRPVREEWPSLVNKEPVPAPVPNEPTVIPDTSPHDADESVSEIQSQEDSVEIDSLQTEENSIPVDMDGLLRWCLLSFLKLHGKGLELPLKTNLLYRNHLIPLCPPDRTLDVKKSTYKKMGKFLEAMQTATNKHLTGCR